MTISIPAGSIVLCVGPSNSGKTTWLQERVARQQLLPSHILSSDAFRIQVSDSDYIDLTDATPYVYAEYDNISKEAFRLLKETLLARAKMNRTSFVDATHLRKQDRAAYIQLGKSQHVPVIALVFEEPLDYLLARDALRQQPRGEQRLQQQYKTFRAHLKSIRHEGFQVVHTIDTATNIQLEPSPLYVDIGQGVDFIGDIHGCYDEMLSLITQLGYEKQGDVYRHPQGRKLVSLGDIMSRGPRSLDALAFWHRQLAANEGYMIDSNHGWKVARWLNGQNVSMQHGDELLVEEFEAYEQQYGTEQTAALKKQYAAMLLAAPSHYIFTENGQPVLVATHAGIRDRYIGKQSRRISDFCRYGDVQGTHDNGRPIRGEWYAQYSSPLTVIWGHEPKLEPMQTNHTINIDQGCVFGGKLTAYRYPEKTFHFARALANYAGEHNNPLTEQRKKTFPLLQLNDYVNGFTVETGFSQSIRIDAARAQAALDLVSHATLPPAQLIMIPPTMSPTPHPSPLAEYLEHPQQAFDYYEKHGVTTMIAQKKHMGSRALLFIAKNKEVTKAMCQRDAIGFVTTRTGRAFFEEPLMTELCEAIHAELMEKNYFEQHQTDYVLLDAEILPWNVKADRLIDQQYATVGDAALLDRTHLWQKLRQRNVANTENWAAEYSEYVRNAARFDAVYKNYIWPTKQLAGIQIAPFHLLAHSNRSFFDETHAWHMEQAAALAENSQLFIETEYRLMNSASDQQHVIQWWEDMTAIGHEGIVVKPAHFMTKHNDLFVQPAIKVRGREYLRIIYGMDYTAPSQLEKLKQRNVKHKMRNAMKEFLLSMEAVNRFVANESNARVFECVLASLALESEPIDPRL